MEKKKIKVMRLDEFDGVGVFAVSLVDIPAIEENWVALSKMEKVQLQSIDEEKRMVYGAVLVPDKLILRIDQTTNEEYYIQFPAETIRAAAHLYMKRGNQSKSTYMHEFEIDGVTTVETWLKESEEDKSTALGLGHLPVGTWFIGQKIDNEAVWQKIKTEKVRGFSIEGLFDSMEEMSKHLSEEEKLLAELERVINEG